MHVDVTAYEGTPRLSEPEACTRTTCCAKRNAQRERERERERETETERERERERERVRERERERERERGVATKQQ